MKKHVIIAGASRAAKTTLSIELTKSGYEHYKMDSIVRGMCDIFDLDSHNWIDLSPKLAKFMDTIINENETDTVKDYEKYVLDIPYLFPKDVKLIDSKNVIIIFLGYAHITKEEMLLNMRKHDKDNYWCKNIPDDKLLEMIDNNIKFSKYLEKECNKLGIPYFDTSLYRSNTLREIKKYIEKLNK